MAAATVLSGDPLAPMTDEEYDEFVASLHEYAPSRFLLIGVADDRSDAGVIGWGMAWDDLAIAYVTGPEGTRRRTHVQARSAQAVRAALAHLHEVRLAWIDPEPCPAEPGNGQPS